MILKNTRVYLFYGILLGCFSTNYMISPASIENRFLSITIFLLFHTITRFRSTKNKMIFLKRVAIGIILGYFISFVFLYSYSRDYQYPMEQQGEYGINPNATILVLPTYPKFYEPKQWKQIILTSPEYTKSQKKLFMPFLLYKYKNIYKTVGVDPSTYIAEEFEKQIQMANRKNNENLYVAYLNQDPLLEEQVIKAIKEGATNIKMINILLDQSELWFQVQERVEKVRLYNYNTRISYSNPFWQDVGLKQALVKKIEETTKENKRAKVGILLVGNEYNSKSETNFNEAAKQQIAFAKDIKDDLVTKGYENKKIKMAFLNNNQYSIKRITSEILDKGISELIIAPISIPFDNIYNTAIIPQQVAKVEVPPLIKMNYVSAWNTHPDFMKEVYKKIESMDKENSSKMK